MREKEEKKKFFVDFIRFINVIEFPNENDNPKRIHLLSLEEQKAMSGVYYLQDYQGEGFSLIIEDVDDDTVNLKIHEPYTDDFFEKDNIVVRKGILDKYKKSDRSNTYLSIGVMEYNNGDIKIRPNKNLQVPLKSISFYEKGEKA
ncbi:hypothetical protein ACFSKN_03225 [Mariniflexile gromovii]|uniref:Uncharacterized protein n=1 Tax=Mariniflexile gromovii TaxID=362523 RepID=A0ABS4BSL2_9FLAO|nr:hypothetical protein [Mariniflexile gromovii]MBP0903575.1 hypothetical protein [Mariniflexile gromovii]